MTNQKKKPFQDAARDIDEGLNGLFGALGDAIGEMVARLEDGNAGAVARDHVIETSKGPIRAHAGVRLRMGGLEAAAAQQTPTPFNPDRPKPAKEAPEIKPLSYEILEDEEDWILTADVPGVRRKELALSQDDTTLIVETTGTRRYRARVDLEAAFRIENIGITLRNGILTLQIKKGA